MAEQRRGGGQGRPPAKRSGSTSGRKPAAGPRAAARKGGAPKSGARKGGAPKAGARKAGAPKSGARKGGSPTRGAGGRSPGSGSRSGSSSGGSGRSSGSGGSGRPSGSAGRSGGSGSRSGGQTGRGAAAPRQPEARRKEGGGFGPFAVDRRDEETREKRGTRSGSAGKGSPSRRPSERPGERPALRTVGKRTERDTTPRKTRRSQPPAPSKRRRKRGPADVQQEMARVAGRNANRALGTLMAAADAFAHDRERETLRILRPLREQLPDSPSVRELAGLAQYRIGNYAAAAKELEAYADLSDAVDQNPVLMDCYRALRRWRKVEELWLELASVSPTAELVAEGRIVYAGALADQGRLPEALTLLRKRAESVKSPREYHLRLWYALADLEERAGNLARARELFHNVRRADPAFADVAERLAALG
jgi:hypothetical protein